MQDALRRSFESMRRASRRAPYPSLAERRERLDALGARIAAEKGALTEALDQDFGGRFPTESLMTEIFPALSAIKRSRRDLRRWMRPERRRVDPSFWFASNRVHYQPLGVVGVMAPWNYPVNLALAPMIGALAAGNRVILRPSSQTPRTAEAIRRVVETALPEDVARVFCGGRDLADAMIGLPFDHLMFTGSTEVGRKVMRAAADTLTPATLELGGKSPVILHESYPHDRAAERIALGKLINGGQTCIAPDYALVRRDRQQALVDGLLKAAETLYPKQATNPEYTAILGEAHFRRLLELVEDARAKGARIVQAGAGGEGAGRNLGGRFPLTLVLDVTEAMRIDQEEIFGPILPIRTYDALEDVFAHLAERPRPLALYYFDDDQRRIDRILRETVSGGAAINDTLLHVAQDDLPFGGVGPSGIGRYHGIEGFRTFSNARGAFHQSRWSLARMMRPPWAARWRKALDFMTRY